MKNTKALTKVALFAAIATVLMYIEFPLPFLPPFLKIDFSGVAVLIAALVLGVKHGFFALLIKDAIHLLSSSTGGVGQLADFLMLGSMLLAVYFVSKAVKGKKGLLLGCMAGTVALIVVGSITNQYLLIPFYAAVIMPMEAIINACQAINPNITSLTGYILWGVVPFNAIKGILLSVVTLVLKPRIEHAWKK